MHVTTDKINYNTLKELEKVWNAYIVNFFFFFFKFLIHSREQPDPEEDPGTWEENFKSHHDTKPHGPTAVAMDFVFPGAEYAYGLPEHADSLALKSTTLVT